MRVALAACILLLAGCTTPQPQPATPRADDAAINALWQAHAARLTQIQSFTVRGRAADGRGTQADVHWQQFADGRFFLRLAGPFGAGAVQIRGDAQAVEIQTRDQRFHTADPEGWMLAHLGWSFPIHGLRHWMLGLPIPQQPAQQVLDDQGRLSMLEQAGWKLGYPVYVDVNGLALPRRLDALQADRRLRLVVDRWEQVEPSG